MKKDFHKWNNRKVGIDGILKRPFFHEREIWSCHLGVNVGFEQDGQGEDFLRPIMIIRKFNNEIFWAVPLTKKKKQSKYYFQFVFKEEEISSAILSQIKLIDARRLAYKIGEINEKDFLALIKKLKELFP